MFIELYGFTQKGKRKKNEDNFFTQTKNNFYYFSIADGLGGYEKGDIASQDAIHSFKKCVTNNRQNLIECIENIHKTIQKTSNEQQTTMATTIVASIIDTKRNKISIAHVGDSRAYIINKNTIWKTKDHTLVQELIELGILNNDTAFHHTEKHRMTQALGLSEKIDISYHEQPLDNNIILLSSDGLHDHVNDTTIAEIARQYSPKEACIELVDTAIANGSTDDITIIIAKPHKKL